jgi:hypothetical protein
VTVLWDNGPPETSQGLDAIGLPWAQVAKFVKLRMRTAERTKPSRRRLVRPPDHLAEIQDRFMVKREPIHLVDALQWTTKTLSTDPRDKTFSLLGLCHDGPTFVPVPNYQQSLETVLIDMSKTIMRMNRSLDLICMREIGPQGVSILPTLVTNGLKI